MSPRAASLLVIAALATGACGGDPPAAPPPPRVTTPPTAEAPPAGADDVVVATVNGRPVWGSCVAAQVAHAGVERSAALDTCVAFELLAQEADARGLRDDPEVAETWRREMVRALIEADIGSLTSIDQIPAEVRDPLLAKAAPAFDRPTMRAAFYALVTFPRRTPEGSPDDLAARAIAEAIYRDLPGHEGVLPTELRAAADRHRADGGPTIKTNDVPYQTPEHEGPFRVATAPFREALFALEEVGDVAPPVRSVHGWFVILYWDERPPADLRPSFFPFARLAWYRAWTDRIMASLGLSITVDNELVAALADAELGAARDDGPAPPPSTDPGPGAP